MGRCEYERGFVIFIHLCSLSLSYCTFHTSLIFDTRPQRHSYGLAEEIKMSVEHNKRNPLKNDSRLGIREGGVKQVKVIRVCIKR